MTNFQKRRSKGGLPTLGKPIAAYMAAIMDGEGHFGIACGGNKAGYIRKRVWKLKDGTVHTAYKPCKNDYDNYTIRIGFANTDWRLIKWALENIGGTYSKNEPGADNWKPSYKWQLYGANAQEKFILATLPYLVIKTEQANILLQFIRLRGVQNPAKRKELYEKASVLNERGACPTTNTPNQIERCPTCGDIKSVQYENAGNCPDSWHNLEDRV